MKIFRKEKLPNGRRHVYLFGIKIASYKHKHHHICHSRNFNNGKNNKINITATNVNVNYNIYGNNNSIDIEPSQYGGDVNIYIRGNNNKIYIKKSLSLKNVNISIGNHFEISNSEIFIDEKVSIVSIEILVEQHHCKLHIGKRCLMSKDILFRLGEIPHLVFDLETKEYVDTPHNLIVGNHVWIGAGATLLKKTKIGDDCIVGAKAVVTKEFNENNVLLAGNPAQIKRRNVYWVKSYKDFEKNEHEYKKNYEKYIKKYGELSNIEP